MGSNSGHQTRWMDDRKYGTAPNRFTRLHCGEDALPPESCGQREAIIHYIHAYVCTWPQVTVTFSRLWLFSGLTDLKWGQNNKDNPHQLVSCPCAVYWTKNSGFNKENVLKKDNLVINYHYYTCMYCKFMIHDHTKEVFSLQLSDHRLFLCQQTDIFKR